MKIIFLLMFSLVMASAEEFRIKSASGQAIANFRPIEDDPTSMELDLSGAVLRGAGKVKAPFLSLQREQNKQGVFLAALPFGGTLSLYRKDSYGNHREFVRMSYGGIQVAKDDGDLQETFTGTIDPNCRPVVVKGLIVGQACETALIWTDGKYMVRSSDGTLKPYAPVDFTVSK